MPEETNTPVTKIEIDRELCIGAASCLAVAPEGFELDGENKAVLKEQWRSLSDEAIREAAKACPVLAIYLYGPDGKRVFPDP